MEVKANIEISEKQVENTEKIIKEEIKEKVKEEGKKVTEVKIQSPNIINEINYII